MATSGKPQSTTTRAAALRDADARDGTRQRVAGAGATIDVARAGQDHVLRADGDAHTGPRLGGSPPPRSVRPPTSTRVTPAARSTTRPLTIVSIPTKRATSSDTGAWKTRAAASTCWIRPPISTATRSASARASPRSCVTSTVVTRSWRSTAPRSAMSAVRLGVSSPANGSSSSRTLGLQHQRPRQRHPLRLAARTAFAPDGRRARRRRGARATPSRAARRPRRRRRESAGRGRRCRRRSRRPGAAPGTRWPSGAARPARRARRPADRGSARCPPPGAPAIRARAAAWTCRCRSGP